MRFWLATAALLELAIETMSRHSLPKALGYMVTAWPAFLFNVCIIGWTFLLLYLVRRKLFLGILISVIWCILGAVNGVLLSCRVTPFNWSDLRLSKDAMAIMGKYIAPWQVMLGAAVLIMLCIGLAFLFRRLPRSGRKALYIRSLAMMVTLFFGLIGLASMGERIGIFPEKFDNLADAYQSYGFVFCFSNSMLNIGISKPEDYSTQVVQEIQEEEIMEDSHVTAPLITEELTEVVDSRGVAVTRKTPNIIFVQLESFSDPLQYTHMKCSKDPIPNFRSLMENYTSGWLDVPAVGAGTANTEFEVITGMNLDFFGPGEYPYKTVLRTEVCESLCFDLKDIGYHAQAIHNNMGTFYDRHTIFSQLGFDTFTSIEYMSNYDTTPTGWPKDGMLADQILKVLNSTTGADMIYTISVQGHGAYPEEKLIESPAVTVSGLETEGETNAMEYYIQQIHEMDSFVLDLVQRLETRGEPAILVLYGDHLPSLNLTEDRLKNGNVLQTQYVIWDNLGLQKQDRELEAYQLAAYALDQVGIHRGTMFGFHQTYLAQKDHRPEEQEKYLGDMEILEYDMLYGEQDIFGGENPYEATKLHMGVQPIRISGVMRQDGGTYVTGWNFTEHSHVYLNGKEMETTFVSRNMLYVPDMELEEGENSVTVAQVSDDNIVLSESETYLLR
ncbi:MAG: sulfatase-like hydrolase/transferase [Eubacteriales bacterium]|nr:sulfatase-like hydrolase/transferase [Eubacteriales bacterium]